MTVYMSDSRNTIHACRRDLAGSSHPPCACDVCELYEDAPLWLEPRLNILQADPYQFRNTYDPHEIKQWIDDLGSREYDLAARERAVNIRKIEIAGREAAVMKFCAVDGCGRGAVGAASSRSTGVRQPRLKNEIAAFKSMITAKSESLR